MEINSHFFKKALGSLVLLLSFWVIYPLTVLAATNYGDGNYGGGNYGVGDLPTSTTTPSVLSYPAPSAPVCGQSASTGFPNLFEIRTTGNTATLYFAPPPMPYSNFYVAFSTKSDSWQYGTQYDQGYSGGVLSFTIHALNPNTKYYFRMRSGNGCAPGNWGNTMTAATTSTSKQTKTYYKNVITAITQQVQKVQNFFSGLFPSKNTNPPQPTATLTSTNNQNTVQATAQPQPTPKPKFCILWWCF